MLAPRCQMPTRPSSRQPWVCVVPRQGPCKRVANHVDVVFVLFTFEMTCTSLMDGASFGAAAGDRGVRTPPALPLKPVFQTSALGATAIDNLHVEKSRAAQQIPGTWVRRTWDRGGCGRQGRSSLGHTRLPSHVGRPFPCPLVCALSRLRSCFLPPRLDASSVPQASTNFIQPQDLVAAQLTSSMGGASIR
jgi:hypothetical protein